jgi:hypothetical protein
VEPVQSNQGSNAGEPVVETPGGETFSAQAGTRPRSINSKPPTITTATATIWLTAVVAVLALIAKYANDPGRPGAIPHQWPAQSLIALDTDRPTLIMFVHPYCPCTRASLGELDSLMARCRGQFNAHVVFVKPAGLGEFQAKSDLWRRASAIPGVTVHSDSSGSETRLFHPETSGQTVLYDRDGRLLFQGGITISRGHAGDNPGRSALVALLNHQLVNEVETPVFGCSLFDTHVQQETAQ